MKKPVPQQQIANQTVNAPPSYQDRAYVERLDLQVKIDKLASFFVGSLFQTLPPGERERLFRQYVLMKQYLDVLSERIAHF